MTRQLYADECRGIYIPQFFAESMADGWIGVTDENRTILLTGPDHDLYWGAWDEVLRDARFRTPNGVEWSLEQDGDLWAVSGSDDE